MYNSTDPTMMLGRQSRLQTRFGVVNGTVLAVGAKGISVAVDRKVVTIPPSEIQEIAAQA